MAQLTIGRELGSSVVRVGSPIIIIKVATHALIGGAVIIPGMTAETIDGYMRACERPVIIMYGESSRLPARIGGMTGLAVRPDPDGFMVRVVGFRIVVHMASGTGIGGAVIIALVAGETIAGNR